MKIAVIGARGQVGAEFEKFLGAGNFYSFTRQDVDVTEIESLEKALGDLECRAIVNLAAYHNLNECDKDPETAYRVNALGVANVAKVCKQKGCKAVSFSSDYIFGKEAGRKRPYLESDQPGPLNVYGESKLAGEQFLRNYLEDHLIIRTSSLFGTTTSSKGWTFPEMIIRRAREGERLRVVDDQCMAPTYTVDLVCQVLKLIEADATGIVHVTNGGECTWHAFATKTLELAGIGHPVEAVSSNAFPSVAKRPAYSVIKSERIAPIRDWEQALLAYLHEKGIIPGKSNQPNIWNYEHS